jgi:hypothetical protein
MKHLAALALLASSPAWAQDRPTTTPTRDVDVLYRAMAGGRSVEQRSRFAVSARKIRIDTPSPGLYLIVDRGAHTMNMVSDPDRGVLEMAYDPASAVGGFASSPGFGRGGFTRTGTDTVAGQNCTEWQTTDAGGRAVTACFTADGVLLRARAGPNVFVEATRVVYGPIEPSVFAVPAGYRRAAAPSPSR